jgi:C4-dicarboxylate transporter DctM subunit
MFIASFLPALGVALVLCLYSFMVGLKHGTREKWDPVAFGNAAKEGVWAMALPVIVVAGIYTGKFPPFKAGAVAFIYALFVTTIVHRELTPRKVVIALANAGRLMGMLILIIAFTFGINKLIPEVGLEQKLTSLLTDNNIGPIAFLIIVNVFLIVIGALMDSVSATLVFAPILAPIAVTTYGIDPIHFGVVFVVNMEIGYLAPPVATNLFVAAALFKKPFGQVSRAILPGLALTTVALFVFMFVPTCSKGLVNAKRGVAFYESFPWDSKRQSAGPHAGSDLGEISDKAGADAEAEKARLDKQTDDEYYFTDEDADAGVEGGGGGGGDGGEDGDAGSDETLDELEGVQL